MNAALGKKLQCEALNINSRDHGVKIDAKSLKSEFHIFAYPGFKTGIARGILLHFTSSKQGGQLFLK